MSALSEIKAGLLMFGWFGFGDCCGLLCWVRRGKTKEKASSLYVFSRSKTSIVFTAVVRCFN